MGIIGCGWAIRGLGDSLDPSRSYMIISGDGTLWTIAWFSWLSSWSPSETVLREEIDLFSSRWIDRTDSIGDPPRLGT